MGYYSEVAICMNFETKEKRDTFYETLVLRTDDVGDVIRNKCQKDDAYPWINYHDDNIKWYESHPVRQSFEETILPLVVECGGAWRLMRLGEEADDYETDEGAAENGIDVPWDAFYLERRIAWG